MTLRRRAASGCGPRGTTNHAAERIKVTSGGAQARAVGILRDFLTFRQNQLHKHKI